MFGRYNQNGTSSYVENPLYIKFGKSKDRIMKKKFAFSGCPH